MKKSQLFVILALWSLLMPINLATKDPSKSFFGGLPWWGWGGIGLLLIVTAVAFAVNDSRRARLLLEEPLPPKPEEDGGRIKLTTDQLAKNVPGCCILGDVSGTPLIKNATNEGTDCVKFIHEELRNGTPPEPKSNVEVAIIGIGPAGLSAAITAQQLGLSYVGIEQDKVLATIEAYPANKYVFFKPETMEARGGIKPEGLGQQRESILEEWTRAMRETGVSINELESCKSVKKAEDGDYFVVQTEQGAEKKKVTYNARRVVLALGNRGTPMKLRVAGEEMKVTRDGKTSDKVMYKLTDPEDYRRKRIIVVGAGNSAIEAAVDLVATRQGDQITFRSDSEINDVTLVIRSDMKNDLKFGNKLQVYDCIDEGRIKVFFGTGIKEIKDDEVVLMNARTEEVKTDRK